MNHGPEWGETRTAGRPGSVKQHPLNVDRMAEGVISQAILADRFVSGE